MGEKLRINLDEAKTLLEWYRCLDREDFAGNRDVNVANKLEIYKLLMEEEEEVGKRTTESH